MIDKKRLIKSLIIISLIIIIIFTTIQIRKTLARYETTATTERDVDVAFWIVDNSFKSQRLLIDDIYPSTNAYTYTFTVSNFNETDKIAETDMEYDLVLTSTTNLPLNYELQRNGVSCLTVAHTDETGLKVDDSGTYYREMKISTAADPYPFSMDTIKWDEDDEKYVKSKVTDTFILKVTFPSTYSSNEQYADLLENIEISLTARQIIEE